MRIVVNDVAASDGGALTVLRSFHHYLSEVSDENEWTFLVGGRVIEDQEHLHCIALPAVKSRWRKRLQFDLVGGRRLVMKLRPDVVFSFQNTLIWGLDCPQVLYVHQALPFQQVRNYSLVRSEERQLAIYQHLIGRLIKLSARHADRIIVQSHWMAGAMTRQLRLPPAIVHVIPPEVDGGPRRVPAGGNDRRQFLYPTAEVSYKNNACVEEACRILVGQGCTDFRLTITIGESRAPNVDAVGRLPRDELLARLACSTLVFPSLIETVGLPLLEARAIGVVVLAADLPYAREALAGYPNAHFFDPGSPQALASLMWQVIDGQVIRLPPGEPPVEVPPSWGRVVSVLLDVAGAASDTHDDLPVTGRGRRRGRR